MLISIIIPAYQAGRTIGRAVESALAIPEKDSEVIVVNDGSTDSTMSILESLARNSSKLKVISQENCGRSSARNAGVKVAKGKWIMFLDADDFLIPEHFPIMLQRCRQSVAPLVVFGMFEGGNKQQSIRTSGRMQSDSSSPQAELSYLSARSFVNAMIEQYSQPKVHDTWTYESNSVWSRLYNRAQIQRLMNSARGLLRPFPEGLRFSEDRLFNIAYLKILGDREVEFVPIGLYCWDLRESQTCAALREDDDVSLRQFCKYVDQMTDAHFIELHERDCIVAREAMGQLRRIAQLASINNKSLIERYISILSSAEISRAIACAPWVSYASTPFWRFVSYLVGIEHAWLAYLISSFAMKAKKRIANHQSA